MSVPNQRTIKICKPPTVPPFLQVEHKNWAVAFKNLTRTAFGLYLYLCENQSGYSLEFSPQAVRNELGCAKSTICDAYQELEKKKYIVDNKFYSCGYEAWSAALALQQEAAENKVSLADYGIADS